MLTDTVTTSNAFGFSNVTTTQSSISFEINKVGEAGTITSISIYDATTDEPVQTGGANIKEFQNLLSDHAYHRMASSQADSK